MSLHDLPLAVTRDVTQDPFQDQVPGHLLSSSKQMAEASELELGAPLPRPPPLLPVQGCGAPAVASRYGIGWGGPGTAGRARPLGSL